MESIRCVEFANAIFRSPCSRNARHAKSWSQREKGEHGALSANMAINGYHHTHLNIYNDEHACVCIRIAMLPQTATGADPLLLHCADVRGIRMRITNMLHSTERQLLTCAAAACSGAIRVVLAHRVAFCSSLFINLTTL